MIDILEKVVKEEKLRMEGLNKTFVYSTNKNSCGVENREENKSLNVDFNVGCEAVSGKNKVVESIRNVPGSSHVPDTLYDMPRRNNIPVESNKEPGSSNNVTKLSNVLRPSQRATEPSSDKQVTSNDIPGPSHRTSKASVIMCDIAKSAHHIYRSLSGTKSISVAPSPVIPKSQKSTVKNSSYKNNLLDMFQLSDDDDVTNLNNLPDELDVPDHKVNYDRETLIESPPDLLFETNGYINELDLDDTRQNIQNFAPSEVSTIEPSRDLLNEPINNKSCNTVNKIDQSQNFDPSARFRKILDERKSLVDNRFGETNKRKHISAQASPQDAEIKTNSPKKRDVIDKFKKFKFRKVT